jgi:tripartite-type tricarboxylate transporter receptor subunit TctC
MKHPLTKFAFAALAAGMLAAVCAPALAQSYPNRPVRVIVGFPGGTGPDIVARLLAQKLSESWGGAAVIVDNKPGAGGVIAAGEASRAQPDGYTLMLGETGQLSIAPSSYNKLPYDAKKDFIPLSQTVTNDFTLLVNQAKYPFRDVKQFVEWAKQQKDGVFMGSFGAGTPGHFGSVLLGQAIGVKAEPVHYKTTGEAMSGIMGGDVAATFASMGLSAPNVKAGKLIAIGSTGPSRSHALPDVPTFAEQGYPQVKFQSWYGMFAPAGTPAAIVAKLEADVRNATRAEDNKTKMETAGFRVTGTSAEEFVRLIAADTALWGKLVAATGFKAD